MIFREKKNVTLHWLININNRSAFALSVKNIALGLLTVELVLHELLVKLRLLGLLRLKLALKFDDILRGFLGRRGHAVGVAVTEAPSCQFTF